MESLYVTLANKRNRFPSGGAAAVGVPRKKGAMALVMEDLRDVKPKGPSDPEPYMFFMPTAKGEVEEEDEESYFVPRKHWKEQSDAAQYRLERRWSLCQVHGTSDRLAFVVRVLAQHANAKKLSEPAFTAAMSLLGVKHRVFVSRAFHHLAVASGTAEPHVEYETLISLLDEFVSGTTVVTSAHGEQKPRWRCVVESCYDLFDPRDLDGKNEGYIAVRDLKIQRGMTAERMATGDPSLITFPMCKALLDFSYRAGLKTIIELENLEEEWSTGGELGTGDPSLVEGFFEEVLRLILIDRFKQSRKLLYK